jgi:hypothetical protein
LQSSGAALFIALFDIPCQAIRITFVIQAAASLLKSAGAKNSTRHCLKTGKTNN